LEEEKDLQIEKAQSDAEISNYSQIDLEEAQNARHFHRK
jgi:hypothetical protein